MTSASACGKTILLGEHAVVYGRPALAVPVSDVRARCEVSDAAPGSGVRLVAQDLDAAFRLDGDDGGDTARALRLTVRNTCARLGAVAGQLDLTIQVSSQIPIARGLGSGTALTTAIVRALTAHLGGYLDAGNVSALVYQTEMIYHGTPSGVDNTVVAWEKPVYFVKGAPPDLTLVGRPVTLVIADSGVPSRTRDAVQDLRDKWLADTGRYERLFDAVGALVERGRTALATGALDTLGALMDENQRLLQQLDVSSGLLDRLIAVARSAGALGCKLTGGGRGGCVVALVTDATRDAVSEALLFEGAARVFPTVVR